MFNEKLRDEGDWKKHADDMLGHLEQKEFEELYVKFKERNLPDSYGTEVDDMHALPQSNFDHITWKEDRLL